MPSYLADLKPMLLDERPFDFGEPGWIYELKFDGYRLLAEFGDCKAFLRTRNGADVTRWFPEATKSLMAVDGGPYVVDGEAVVLDDKSRSDFDRLHSERAGAAGTRARTWSRSLSSTCWWSAASTSPRPR
jgi:bifunctional non-homologous end joining protein LigD